MIFQYELIQAFQPILGFVIMLVLIALMLLVYLKIENWLITLVLYLFSIIIGALSATIGDIPFTPYFQIFFIVFQTIIFVITSWDAFGK